MDLGLSGKRFAVTGGTRGIGRAVVDGLLAEGAAVAYCARTPGGGRRHGGGVDGRRCESPRVRRWTSVTRRR